MAGTDLKHLSASDGQEGQPVIVLVEPQLGENIGATARAMLNFGLTDLRLVAPRDGWPNERAIANAAGADRVLERAEVFSDLPSAIADCQFLLATTARARDMVKPVLTPATGIEEARRQLASGHRVGFLFGPERAGLINDHVAAANAILTIPANPGFTSLNLAQAVLLLGYEWFQQTRGPAFAPPAEPPVPLDEGQRPATQAELTDFFDHLERELIASGFLFPEAKRPRMIRNIRNIFARMTLRDQDVRTLRGMIRSLALYGGGRGAQLRQGEADGDPPGGEALEGERPASEPSDQPKP